MINIRKIVHLVLPMAILTVLSMLLPVTSATGQVITVYTGEIKEFAIAPQPEGSTYKWEIYCDLTLNFAQTPGDCSDGEVVSGQNSETARIRFSKAGQYIVKIEVWDPVACTNNMKFYMVEVLEALPTANLDLSDNEICVNEPSVITITLTGEPVWKFTLQARDEDGNIDLFHFNDIGADENPYEFTVSPQKTTWYTVIEVTDKNGTQIDPSNTVQLRVHPLPVNTRIYLKE